MHTFLFREGRWRVQGIYKDDNQRKVEVTGESVIVHSPDIWIHDSVMQLMTEPPLDYRSRYEIIPFTDGCDTTAWKSQNTALGKLSGHFTVFDDSILSVYQSPDGNIRGTEFFLKQKDTQYISRGVLFRGKVKLSSWTVILYG